MLAQIQYLKTQLAALEQQLLLRGTIGTPTLGNCYTDGSGRVFCATNAPSTLFYTSATDIDRIEVDFVGDIAQVRVEYDDDDDEFYAVEADTESDVARLLEPELRVAASTLLRLMDEVDDFDDNDRNDDDIEDIDVDWDGDDADVTVRFEDDDTDRFTINNVDRDEDDVIEEIADRYNEDEDDIEDVIDFDDDRDDDDIDSIDVDFFGDDADIIVRFEDGDTERFTLTNVDNDEDEVIERLADRYDMDEDDIEDIIDFN